MFHQVDSSASREYEGIGLGLYIAEKYTEVLGGTIKVESEPGERLNLHVYLAYRSFLVVV